MPFLSNAFLVGDQRKYLTMLLTLKCDQDQNLAPTNIISNECLEILKSYGVENVTTIE